MKVLLPLGCFVMLLTGCVSAAPEHRLIDEGLSFGTLHRYEAFPSAEVPARTIDVWLPPGYDPQADRRYPVIYAQDAQNLFRAEESYGGEEWGLDETLARLASESDIALPIVVAIWNTPERFAEYMPEQAQTQGAVSMGIHGVPDVAQSALRADAYLRFLVEEVKPFIDRHYATKTDLKHAAIMGSSMGGLLSAYAVAEYPEVFGAAACLSSHWPAGDGAVVRYLETHLPEPGVHRWYFDHGTETLDAAYEPYQRDMDRIMVAKGYRRGADWQSRRFDGAPHSEAAWRARLDIPLRFLLNID